MKILSVLVYSVIMLLATIHGRPIKTHSDDLFSSISNVLDSLQPSSLLLHLSTFFDSLIESARSFEWPFGRPAALPAPNDHGDSSEEEWFPSFSPRPVGESSSAGTSFSDSESL